jgi:hypothetical protein
MEEVSCIDVQTKNSRSDNFSKYTVESLDAEISAIEMDEEDDKAMGREPSAEQAAENAERKMTLNWRALRLASQHNLRNFGVLAPKREVHALLKAIQEEKEKLESSCSIGEATIKSENGENDGGAEGMKGGVGDDDVHDLEGLASAVDLKAEGEDDGVEAGASANGEGDGDGDGEALVMPLGEVNGTSDVNDGETGPEIVEAESVMTGAEVADEGGDAGQTEGGEPEVEVQTIDEADAPPTPSPDEVLDRDTNNAADDPEPEDTVSMGPAIRYATNNHWMLIIADADAARGRRRR